METLLQDIFNWIPSGGIYYLLIGAISFLESLAVVGIFCPGSILIIFAGFLAAHGKGDYFLLMGVSAAGSFAGDMLSYLLGARIGSTLLKHPFLMKRKELLRKSELFFIEHGGKSVFFGRFVGFLRPFIPFIAGSSQMRPLLFTLYALVSGILWGVAYPGIGYFFGASWTLVRLWTGRFSLLVAVLAILLVLNTVFWKKLVPVLVPWCSRYWSRLGALWRSFLEKPQAAAFIHHHPKLWDFLLGRINPRRGSGLYLTIGFAISLIFALLFAWLATDLPFMDRIDRQLYYLLSEARHTAVTTSMLVITFLANGPVIAMLTGLVFLWLILDNRDFSALLLLIGIGGGELLVFLLAFFAERPQPSSFPSASLVTASGIPGGHAFTALVFCGLTAYFFLGSVRNWQSRLVLLVSASLLASMVGFSRIYLGINWLSTVLAGFALAALWLSFLITASELRRRFGGEFPWRTSWHPVQFSRPVRLAVIWLAGSGVLVWTIRYILISLAGF